MTNLQQSQLAAILLAGSHLLESGRAARGHDLKNVLSERLEKYYSALGKDRPALARDTLEELQVETARCALEVLEHVQHLLNVDTSASEKMSKDLSMDDIPVIGARDLTELRTLSTMIFRWGIELLLSSITATWLSPPAVTKVVDLTNTTVDYQSLTSLLMQLVAIFFPHGVQRSLSHTLITTTILHRHMTELFRASMTLGWLPKSLSSEECPTVDALRPFVLRLLEFIPLSQVMTDLGAILSSTPPPPSHVRRLCSSLLSKSLLRPEGVRALFAAIFGEQEGPEDPQLEKYEHVGSVLMSVPAGMKPEMFYEAVVPQVISLISHDVPAAYRRAASFSISRMLDLASPYRSLISSHVLPVIHGPLLRTPPATTDAEQASSNPLWMPSQALSTLLILLLNTDPSPVFITFVLSPVVPALYALMFHLDRTKASDPVMRESIQGLLSTWGRVVEPQEGVDTLWSIVASERIHWDVDSAGDIKRIAVGSNRSEKLDLLTPAELHTKQEEWNIADDLLDLYPNPAHIVRYLKSLDRSDIVSELFIKLLEAYYSSQGDPEPTPKKVLLYAQMIMEMQAQLSGGTSSNLLNKPEHILLFVKHALKPSVAEETNTVRSKRASSGSLRLEDLRIVSEDEFSEDGDSDDDEFDEMGTKVRNDNATATAIDLLLATLEANPGLSARNAPVLNDIFSLLEPFVSDSNELTRTLAREGRIVMTARLASTSTSWASSEKTQQDESPQEIYQKALKLLQDPILPVRAHGLLLLRQLVSSCSYPSSAEAALVPAIMSIFMESVQEEDSYIFLNAVQGLSAMVNAFGKEVLRSLLDTYTHRVVTFHGPDLTRQEIDTKVRVGEALGQVIRRCGDALSIYVDIVVPRLISVFRSSQAPTLLRTSAISLLTDCMQTSAISLLRYSAELSTGIVDLLQVEMKPAASRPRDEPEKAHEVLDTRPTAVDSKLPPLRRAALHFWTLLLRHQALAVYDRNSPQLLTTPLLRRVKVTLAYIASTDEDHIVRVMAREANEAVDQLNRAKLGI